MERKESDFRSACKSEGLMQLLQLLTASPVTRASLSGRCCHIEFVSLKECVYTFFSCFLNHVFVGPESECRLIFMSRSIGS